MTVAHGEPGRFSAAGINKKDMNKIRVGLLLEDFEQSAWACTMVRNIQESASAEVVLVIKKETQEKKKSSPWSFIREKSTNFFYKVYVKLENRFTKNKPDAFAPMDLRPLIGTAAIIPVQCIEKKFSDYIREEDLAVIRQHKPDVLIRMGFRILRGGILQAARYGIWSYHHGDNFRYRGGPNGFWEVFKGEKEVGAVLQILTEDLDGGQILFRSWSGVEAKLNSTQNTTFWKTTTFISRKLNELHRLGPDEFFRRVEQLNQPLTMYSGRNYTMPKGGEFIRLFCKKILKAVKRKMDRLIYKEQWILLYAFQDKPGIAKSIFRYKRLQPSLDKYWADPFPYYRDGRYYIFFEEVPNPGADEVGHISVMEIKKNGEVSEPVIVLKKDYHLSYPFLFEHNGELYMIPETSQHSTVELYKCTGFPTTWEFAGNLLENIKATDSTLLYKDGKYWLFATVCETAGASMSEELFLFHADELIGGNWQPHPGNPVISDVRSARPAGAFFTYNGKLYRPSQDCAGRYGFATNINEVLELNEHSYREQRVTRVSPDWAKDVLATHTLTFSHDLTMIDAIVKRRKW